MFQLRQYQKDILNKLYKSVKNNRKVLLSLPTGGGKTVMMASWANLMAERGLRTAIIVNREELVEQTVKLLPDCSVLKSRWKNFDSSKLIQVIMLQTAYNRRQQLLDLDCDFIFFDEIHDYYDGQMFASICDCQTKAKIIGVSATPIDNKGYLLKGFDDYINEIQTQDLIDMKYLVKPQYYTPQSYNLDLSFIRITNGDYDIGELDDLMANTSCAAKIYNEWHNIASDLKTIVFCSSIKQAKILNEYFSSTGVKSDVVFSSRVDRSKVIQRFIDNKIQVIFNVGILVAGFDDKQVECIVFANPTKILRRYLQQCGRGLRIAPNKIQCIMLDCADIVRQHGFCNDLRYFRPKQRLADSCTVKQCPECGAIVEKTISICPYCGYEFTEIDEQCNNSTNKKNIQRLEKAFSMQNEIKKQIAELVEERGYKNGYKWFLFIDCLKTKRPTESSIQFFKRKITKLNKIKNKGWKLASLKYD